MKIDYAALMIAVTGTLYAATTVNLMMTSRFWMGVMYFGYFVGNVGALALAMGRK